FGARFAHSAAWRWREPKFYVKECLIRPDIKRIGASAFPSPGRSNWRSLGRKSPAASRKRHARRSRRGGGEACEQCGVIWIPEISPAERLLVFCDEEGETGK